MSQKISVVSISLALLSLMLFSCAKRDESYLSVFERSFSANVTVINADGEYRATVSLSELSQQNDDIETQKEPCDTQTNGSDLRDGNISYTYPQTITEISAVRVDGSVCVNVCGIDVRPSENIASKYTYLLDLLDIRRDKVKDAEDSEFEGRAAVILTFDFDDEETTVYIDCESKLPILLKNSTVTLYFDSFTYL